MTLLDDATPEQHRDRYFALKRQAEARARLGRPAGTRPKPMTEDRVIRRESIPAGWYWTVRIARGQCLRIATPTGRAAVSTLLWNADDPVERFNAGDTVKLQWTALIGEGHLLYSDMGRVLASIVEDGGGGHDALTGGSSAATNRARWADPRLRNTRDNFLIAAAKLGLSRRDVMPCITFFAPVRTTAEGGFRWQDGLVKPGAHVVLRAEMNLLAVLSNCPHPLDPRADYDPGAVETVLWQGDPPAPDDPCRTAGEEAVRGFENTDRLFAPASGDLR